MQYREDKYGNKLSVLGFGCMRFTQKGGRIDIEKAEKELIAAYKRGVNYYDTAYIYPGSEAVIGEIFERNGIRDKINIATKLPQYMVKSLSDLDKYFDEQLRRLRTNHVDYYLMHMLNDDKSWARLCALGIEDWINRQKETGRIRQIGFSYHGNSDVFCRLIDAYDWDFCQVQYNYLDENSQAGRTGVQHAASKGIPVVIMEPLRGGKLVNKLPEKAKKQFEAYNAAHELSWSPAEWSFRWLWNQPEVKVVLSGMNSLDMVDEKKLAFNPAVELSFLTKEEQTDFLEAMEYGQATPSLSQAQRIKKLSQDGKCTLEAMCAVMSEEKKSDLDHVTIKQDVLKRYFPKSYTPKQMEDTIIKLLDQWQKKRERMQETGR